MFARMRRIVLCMPFLVSGSPVIAQDVDEVARLRNALETQQALNQELLRRIEALEAGQAAVLRKIRKVEAAVPDEATFREERASVIEEIREEYFDLQDRLDLLPTVSGYYHFEYSNDDRRDSPGRFDQHVFSLHLSKEWDKWRLFSETEFEHGAQFEGAGGTELEVARGEIELEQIWGEYLYSDELTLRAGFVLTPGYWNVNHYPNVVLSTRRPLMVRKVFRESFIGLMGYGTRYWDEFGLTYYAYLGNGESAFFTGRDDNEGKAVGGKFTFHLPTKEKLEALDLSLSMYHESPSGGDRVFTWGVETQVRKAPWELLGEFAMKDGEQDRAGLYIQPSYRWNEKWAAFYRYDLLSVEHEGETQEHTLGVNFRPIPDVSLKLEYYYSRNSNEEDFNAVATSVAIHF